MSMKKVSLKTQYPVDTGEITINIVIGEGQLGSSVVFLDSTEIKRGDIRQLAIGKGQEIKGHKIFIKTVVSDINDKTNRTSVIYIIEGGKEKYQQTLEAIVEENGDVIRYYAEIELS